MFFFNELREPSQKDIIQQCQGLGLIRQAPGTARWETGRQPETPYQEGIATMSRTAVSRFKIPLLFAALFLFSLAGALAEGLWASIPQTWVQFNGLILLLSALALLANGALTATRRLRPTA
jgi:hypothetical protein